MGQALYRSHRPKKLGDVVGQEHITTALAHALEKGTVSHAYLFTGPRGTGKTSIARILAHEINGLPYDEQGAMHLDIIEIDAASNRRIDEIRDLRDKVNLAPAAAKFKVYIIDEVHMLTREAFNALLKTLEEPPAHVVFILATTEVHKLPETIISRTQHFAFRPVEQGKVAAHLRSIAEAEKIAIDDDALALIAAHGEGSFRDSISLLDQLRNQGEKITLEDVQNCLGIAPAQAVAALLSAMHEHDAAAVATQLKTLHEHGYEPSHLARQLAQSVREALINKKPTLPSDVSLKLLTQLVAVPASPEPRVALEIAALDAAFAGEAPTAAAPRAAAKTSAVEVDAKPASITEPHPSAFSKKLAHASQNSSDAAADKTAKTLDAKPADAAPQRAASPTAAAAHAGGLSDTASAPDSSEPPTPALNDTPPALNDDDPDAPTSNASITVEQWAEVLAAIKARYSTLYGIIRAASPAFAPGTITLTSAFAFHQKRLKEPKNKEIIARTVQELTGEAMRIDCVVGKVAPAADLPPALPPADGEVIHSVTTAPSAAPDATPPAPNVAKTTDAIATVSNIFGGAELLQS